jgi:hypothetical protein
MSQDLARFEERYSQRAVAFDWSFGRDDLDKLCARLDAHRQAASRHPRTIGR